MKPAAASLLLVLLTAHGGQTLAASSASDRSDPPAPKIKVDRATPDAAPSPALRAAYAALQARDYDTALRLYEELLSNDPRNLDVLLGLGAIATYRGDTDTARSHYLRILRIEPRNRLAQAALLGMFGRADFHSAEARLKDLLTREPSAFLYYTLGNLYAEQPSWPQAQQAYFQAYHLEPGNADYAYNLAIGLEHVGQRPLAVRYYRRAVELARTKGSAHFDVARAQDRIARIGPAGE